MRSYEEQNYRLSQNEKILLIKLNQKEQEIQSLHLSIKNKNNNSMTSSNNNTISKASTLFSHSTPSIKSKGKKGRSNSLKNKMNIPPVQLMKVEEKLNDYLKLINFKMKEVSKGKRNSKTYRARSACSISSSKQIDCSFTSHTKEHPVQLSQMLKSKKSSSKKQKKTQNYKTIPLNRTHLKNMSIYLKNPHMKKDLDNSNNNKSDIFHIKNLLLNNSSVNNNNNGDNINSNIYNNSSISLCGSNNILRCIMESGNSTNTNSSHKCKNKMNLRQIIFNKCVVNNNQN